MKDTSGSGRQAVPVRILIFSAAAGGSLVVLFTGLVGQYALRTDLGWPLLLLVGVILLSAGMALGVLSGLLIRQHQRAEAALEESEGRLQSVVNGAPVALFILDADGTITHTEGRMLETLRPDSDGLVGQSAFDVFQDSPEFLAAVRGALAGDPISAVIAVEGFWFDCRLTPRVDAKGRPAGLIGVATDVTQPKRLEARLLEAHKMESIGELTGGVAHDFNNVLTVVSGNAELLLADLEPGDDAVELVQEIREAADRGVSLTRRLRELSRRKSARPELVQVNDVVRDVEKVVRRLLGPDIDLVLCLDERPDSVLADVGSLEQLIIDLATNARDAMPRNGKLVIEVTNVELDEVYAEGHERVVPGRYVMLAVSDTGTGIDPDIRPRIFEPFFTTRERSGAAGLGLSGVYSVVKGSGGCIWVHSEAGHGSTFKIYLPSAGPRSGVGAKSQPVEGSRGCERLLVVDDEEEVRAVMRAVLSLSGYEVLEASGGAEALEICAACGDSIDLLVTDVVMPGMDGHELAVQLRERRPSLKVLLVSGYPATIIEHHHGIMPAGMDFLQKPFSGDDLARKVRQVLDSEPISIAEQRGRSRAG